MHNVLSRIQNVFGFFTTVTSVVALVIAVTALISTPAPALSENSLKLHSVQVAKRRANYYTHKEEECAHIQFDLDVDLSTLFTWNTKQIFLYVTATYPSSTTSANTPESTAVIWDAVLPHPLAPVHHNSYVHPTAKGEKPSNKKSKTKSKSKLAKKDEPQLYRSSASPRTPGIIRLDSQRPKYLITDPSGSIAGRGNATLHLNWNIQPWVGALTWSESSSLSARSRRWAWETWQSIPAGSSSFDFPRLKDRKEAGSSAGAGTLKTEKGAEAYRLHVG